MPNIGEGGITHPQYADDTILFFEPTYGKHHEPRISYFLLKEMSSMIINYNKSEIIMVQMSRESGEGIAYTFNCKSGSLPMKYLGIPVSDVNLTKSELSEKNKVRNRLKTWKCGSFSYGGKSIVLNTYLTIIPCI